jgi:hypothetical protein
MMNAEFTEWEARLILESLVHEEERYREAIAVSEDENEVADLDNDLIKLRLTLKRFKDQAVKLFGPGIMNFDRRPL